MLFIAESIFYVCELFKQISSFIKFELNFVRFIVGERGVRRWFVDNRVDVYFYDKTPHHRGRGGHSARDVARFFSIDFVTVRGVVGTEGVDKGEGGGGAFAEQF